jgi:hypothetical protein
MLPGLPVLGGLVGATRVWAEVMYSVPGRRLVQVVAWHAAPENEYLRCKVRWPITRVLQWGWNLR